MTTLAEGVEKMSKFRRFALWFRNIVNLTVILENQAARFAELERRLVSLTARVDEIAATHNKFHDAVERTLHARFSCRVRLSGTLNKLLSDDDHTGAKTE